jgi:hypothetical protein
VTAWAGLTTILESSRTVTIDVLVRKDMVVNEHKRLSNITN